MKVINVGLYGGKGIFGGVNGEKVQDEAMWLLWK
jgi:hypothetical protein